MKRWETLERKLWLATTVLAALVPGQLVAQAAKQSVQVHGHWAIEVRDQDGTVRSRREFENALVDAGKTILIDLFNGVGPIGSWQIIVNGSPNPCLLESFTDILLPANCRLVEPSSPYGSRANAFRNLTKTANRTAHSFVLQGSFVVATEASLSVVATGVEGAGFFTQANLSSPIAVQSTQTVSVTVTFTFS